ncbi:protein K [Escherichia coli]|uniref:protein K n=1 Tax=Escherichia coli TaxID=562 RepID=UPI00193A69FF|nr:protein K [Escherichia coli]
MRRKIILRKKELLLLIYKLNRSGMLEENEKIHRILAQVERILLSEYRPQRQECVRDSN